MASRRGGGLFLLGLLGVVAAVATAGDAASQGLKKVTPPRPASSAGVGGAVASGAAFSRATRVVTHVPPLTDPLNAAFLQQLTTRSPKKCGPQEMAPGVWVRVDCQAYKEIPKASPHYGPRKMKMLKSGLLRSNALFARSLRMIKSQGGAAPEPPGAGRGGERAARPGADDGPAARAGSEGDAPETVDLRDLNQVGPVKDQGAVGACTAFALSSVLDGLLRRQGKAETVSPLHLWSHYGSPHMDSAYDANIHRAITTYETWPYSGRTACQLSREADDECGSIYGVRPNTWEADARVQKDLGAAESAGKHRFVSIERLDRSVDVDEVMQVLAAGQPLWVAFKIDGDKWRNRNIRDGVIQDWSDWEGGHAVALVGYRKTRAGARQFLIQNSWSEKWGDQGFAWVSEAMVKRYMYHAYKVQLDPGSAPPKEITDEDCAWDKIADFGLNQCADFCPDDNNPRPHNGKCGGGAVELRKR